MHNAIALTTTAQLLWSTLRIRLLAWHARRQRLRTGAGRPGAPDIGHASQRGTRRPSVCSTCRARVAGSAHGTSCSA